MTHYGKQQGRLVPCKLSQDHGFHPECEACSWCAPDSKSSQKSDEDLSRMMNAIYGYDMDDYLFP